MIYLANEKYNTLISQGYSFGDPTIYVNLPPDNVPTLITFAVGTEFESTYEVTGKTLSSLTGVSYVRGYAGDYDAQTPITCLNNEEFINQFTQAVTSPESLGDVLYAIDGGSTDAYAISLDRPPLTYFEGMFIQFKPHTANTGACTLNVNGLGAKVIKHWGNDMMTGEIKAGQIISLVYNGTNFEIINDTEVIPISRIFTTIDTEMNMTSNPGGRFKKSQSGNTTYTAVSSDGDVWVLDLTISTASTPTFTAMTVYGTLVLTTNAVNTIVFINVAGTVKGWVLATT